MRTRANAHGGCVARAAWCAGITGYRDDSLESVKRNASEYSLPLHILSYKDLYGWSMDDIVREIGLRGNCTFCGVFRRQALDRGAKALRADKIATGHNADDMAETVLMNLLRGDIARLGRCVSIVTGADGDMPRCKPFKYTYEKEIVLYAYHRKLDYFCTECIYSPNAYRGYAREYIKHLELIRPSAILDIIHSAEAWKVDERADATAAPAAGGSGTGGMSAGRRPMPTPTADPIPTSTLATSKQDGGNNGSACASDTGKPCACASARATSCAPQEESCSPASSAHVPRAHINPLSTSVKLSTFARVQSSCVRCGYMTSTPGGYCHACSLLAGLEAGKPRLGLTSASTSTALVSEALGNDTST
ncbi:adenine nucleotide alpha hydrolase family protein, partial [archaeon]